MKKIIIVIISTILVSGCSFLEENRLAVKNLIDENRKFASSMAKKPKKLDTYETFNYSSFNERDPFEKFIDEKVIVEVKNAIKPNFEREKEYLEQFELSELELTGIMKKGDDAYVALFYDGFQNHILNTQKYVGKNFGKIVKIEDTKVHIDEIYKDEGVNVWIKKEVILEINPKNVDYGKNNKVR